MKARPTIYKGITMRSRNEAAFAQYLDKQKWNWEYEPLCFADATGQYLPDFQILFDERPGSGFYVEVKPTADMAWKACRSMTPIRSTYPDAVLAVAAPWVGWKFGCFGVLRSGETEWKEMTGYWPDLPPRAPGPCVCGSDWIDPEFGRCGECVAEVIIQSGDCSGRCRDKDRPAVEYCSICPFYDNGS